IFFYTTCGWMMWNWLLYCLASKSSIVLYDGSPTYPKVERLLAIAESENCTRLGVSAKYIDLLKSSSIKAIGSYPFGKLKTIISTGSVLSPESFKYVYQNLKADIHLASISGGTDICGCFVRRSLLATARSRKPFRTRHGFYPVPECKQLSSRFR
ncbi:MAG: hypothetical protein RL622_856, partial [Actinomycetota bacterium]